MLVMPKRDETILFGEDDSKSCDEADVVSLSSTSGSGHLASSPPVKDAEKEIRNKIINQEEKNVRNARFIVIAAGIACAAAVGAAINIFAHQNDQASFELEVRKGGRRQNRPCLLAFLTQFIIVCTTQYDGFATNIVALVLLEIQFNFALMQ
jgi:ABC-type xylose transport system permease subunit